MRKRDVERLMKKKRKQALFLESLLCEDGLAEEIIGRGLDERVFKIVVDLDLEADALMDELIDWENDYAG